MISRGRKKRLVVDTWEIMIGFGEKQKTFEVKTQ